ncbi:DUF6520 family protein [Arenibacter sp. M-2]|uniref:DUF6520 family protein n=1 Tax=Arenibacter sp. M-2 TaxID=3053612 RepID=UPI00256FDF14|nr:DUF6520 family protein [Arenibacter sp. M-2]MDL5514009.1 DUF6520 family protein [Arenibacter sp. M-2]
MKKLKMILPMLAFIFAIALSFAFKPDNAVIPGYVNHPLLGWTPIDADCTTGDFDCQIRFEGETTTLNVYPEPKDVDDEGNPIEPLKSNSPEPIILD